MPLAEKLLPGERWQDAVLRACQEELGPVLPEQPEVRQHCWCAALHCTAGRLGPKKEKAAPLHHQPPLCLRVSLPALPAVAQIAVDEASFTEVVEEKDSQSYPGLSSRYICKRVAAKVAGLPQDSFVTDEQRSDGLLRHCWEWR